MGAVGTGNTAAATAGWPPRFPSSGCSNHTQPNRGGAHAASVDGWAVSPAPQRPLIPDRATPSPHPLRSRKGPRAASSGGHQIGCRGTGPGSGIESASPGPALSSGEGKRAHRFGASCKPRLRTASPGIPTSMGRVSHPAGLRHRGWSWWGWVPGGPLRWD